MTIKNNGVVVATTVKGTPAPGRFVTSPGTITIRHEYTNHSDTRVYVKTQASVPMVLDPAKDRICPDEGRPHVEIRTYYELNTPSAIYETYEILSSFLPNVAPISEDAEALLNQLRDHHSMDATRNRTRYQFAIVKRVLLDDLRREDAVLVRETDVVLTVHKSTIYAPHPNSREGMQQLDIANDKRYKGHSGFIVRVVDNEMLASKRFMYSANTIVEVPSIVDQTTESGVYFTISTANAAGVVEPVSSYFSFEEAKEKIGLYNSRQEAMTKGSPDKIAEMEMARLKEMEMQAKRDELEHKNAIGRLEREHEFKMMEAKAEAAKAQALLEEIRRENSMLKESQDVRSMLRSDTMETRKAELEEKKVARNNKSEKRKWKAELKKMHLELEKRRREDRFERQSIERKGALEILKFAPAVVIGALGVYGAFRGMKA